MNTSILTPYEKFITNLPVFQRMRRIGQLNICAYAEQKKDYSRYTHSMGTHRNAIAILDVLQKTMYINSSYVKITRLAALMHDIGHCSLSHVFDDEILPLLHVHPSDHEFRSADLAWQLNRKYGHHFDITPKETDGISELIRGIAPENVPLFMLQIVCNNYGLDADRIDHIERDYTTFTGNPSFLNRHHIIRTAYIDTFGNLRFLEETVWLKIRKYVHSTFLKSEKVNKLKHQLLNSLDNHAIAIISDIYSDNWTQLTDPVFWTCLEKKMN